MKLGISHPKRLRPATSELKSEILICGCGHSGTTLIANIMAAHPDTFVPLRETYIFSHSLGRAMLEYSWLKRRARLSEKPYLVEKTPKHIERLSLCRRIAPNARFVIPVRDGRDVVASIVRRGHTPKEGVDRWIHDNTIVLAQRERSDTVIYRHEDLVKEPAAVLQSICEQVGVSYRPEMLDYHSEERLWFGAGSVEASKPYDNHSGHRNWQVNQPIFDSGGRWRQELRPEDLEPLRSGPGGDLMRAFGYLSA